METTQDTQDSERLAADLLRVYTAARAARDGAAYAAPLLDAPGAAEAMFGALEPEDRAAWLAVAEEARALSAPRPAAPQSPVYASVNLFGRNDLGVCRVERGEVCGASLLRLVAVEKYPWRVLWVPRNAIHSIESVPEEDALRVARAARRRGEAEMRERAARRAALAAATVAISATPDTSNALLRAQGVEVTTPDGPDDILLTFSGPAPDPRQADALCGAILSALAEARGGVRRHNVPGGPRRSDVEWTFVATPAEAPVVAQVLARFGVGRVVMPDGSEYAPPPPDTSDPFEGSLPLPLDEDFDDGIPF